MCFVYFIETGSHLVILADFELPGLKLTAVHPPLPPYFWN